MGMKKMTCGFASFRIAEIYPQGGHVLWSCTKCKWCKHVYWIITDCSFHRVLANSSSKLLETLCVNDVTTG